MVHPVVAALIAMMIVVAVAVATVGMAVAVTMTAIVGLLATTIVSVGLMDVVMTMALEALIDMHQAGAKIVTATAVTTIAVAMTLMPVETAAVTAMRR